MENYFSAADLVKKSATQIKYLREKRLAIYNWKMEKGIQFQKEIAEKKEDSAEEFRTSYTKDDIVIFATHDIVTPDKLIEVKTIEFGDEQWYLESSLVQTAFYKSLVMLSNGLMFTPKFRIKEGYRKEMRVIDKDIRYFLQFGETSYEVTVSKPQEIVDYFVEKAVQSLGSYEDCRLYDYVHKWKHFKELKKYFKYKKVK